MNALKILFYVFILLTGVHFYSTALIDAVIANDYNKVESLLKAGAHINEQDDSGYTALMRALSTSQFSTNIFELLLKYEPDLDVQSSNGQTALSIAAWEGRKKIAYSLRSKMILPDKCCFVTFAQSDFTDVIVNDLTDVLFTKIIAISSPIIFNKVLKKNKFLWWGFNTGQFTLLASQDSNLLVIIPESLEELGLTISSVEEQKEFPILDLKSLENKYGFKNLRLINPDLIDQVLNNAPVIKDENVNILLKQFRSIIDIDSSANPTRFYLEGHGMPGIVAEIPVSYFAEFLSTLSEIGAEFLYINSCYAAGSNLLKIQADLTSIVNNQISSKQASGQRILPGINYAIVLQATSGNPTGGFGNVKKMFVKLNQFLKDPTWALEFGAGVEKPALTISDVIAALRLEFANALPSIRLPGKAQFFRPINIGSIEIITSGMLYELGLKRTLELIQQSKSSDKSIADKAKVQLNNPLNIEIQIKPDINYIQILPIDLSDFVFAIHGNFISKISGTKVPAFISKLPGNGQHFIGGIRYSSNGQKSNDALDELTKDAFGNVLGSLSEFSRCWFIKSVNLNIQGVHTHIKKLAIKVASEKEMRYSHASQYSYTYVNESDKYILSDGFLASPTDKKTFESTVHKWFQETIPSQATLTEATGGVEITAAEKARLQKEKGGTQALRLLEPRFARTPEDLFNMFMAD